MTEKEIIQKYREAWDKFQNKMLELKKRQSETLLRISEKLDKQHIDKLRQKIKGNE